MTGAAKTLRRLDQIIVAGIGLLVFLTPMCFGSVHPWAYTLMEADRLRVGRGLDGADVAWRRTPDARRRAAGGGRDRAADRAGAGADGLGDGADTAGAARRTFARGPRDLRARAARMAGEASYRDVNFDATARDSRPGRSFCPPRSRCALARRCRLRPPSPKRPRRSKRSRGEPRPATRQPQMARAELRACGVARSGMLKALAYAAIFLLVALYPFGAEGDPHAEERFCRTILVWSWRRVSRWRFWG